MTIPASGTISLVGHVLAELQIANPSRALPIKLTDADVRSLAGVASGTISLTDLRGKSAAHPQNFSGSISNTSITSGIRSVTLVIGATGTASGSTNWFTPTTTGAGNAYWVKFTSSGAGTWSGDVRGTVYALTANQSITVANTGAIVENLGTITVSIYSNAAGTNLVATGTVNYDVGYTGA